MNLGRILILRGPRRTGKTTIIYQIIENLLAQGVKPFNILYLSFDDIDLRVRLSEILKVWEKEAKQVLEKEPLLYLFLDEVQFLDFWEIDVKLFYDKKYPIVFFASGSSTSLIRKTTESLSGRTFEKTLLPFDFQEFLYFEGESVGFKKENLGKLRRNEISFVPFETKLFLLWEKYLERGGFPHLLKLPSSDWKWAVKEDIVDKVLYRDLVQLYGIREPETLERMFRYVAEVSSGVLNLSDLSSNLKISWESAQNYLTYLKQAFLIFTLPKYSRSPKETARSLEKVHVVDSAIMSIFSQSKKAALWETVVARHLWETWGRNTYFWRNTREVDIVLEDNRKLLPVEVKSSEKVDAKDLKGLTYFMKKFGSPRGIVFYSGKERLEKVGVGEIFFYPVYKLGFNLLKKL